MFELTPDNRNQPDEVLLDDLKSAWARANGRPLTRILYESLGRFSPATIANRFGGWGKALQRAGIELNRRYGAQRSEVIEDILRVKESIGAEQLTIGVYRQKGKFSEKSFSQFGGWVCVLEASGLKVSDNYHRRVPDEDLFENLENVWQSLGRQPTVGDMVPPVSRFADDVYKRRFGGWRKALEAFVRASNEAQNESEGPLEAVARAESMPEQPKGRTNRGDPSRVRSVGWRLRYSVLRRDRFSCRACGRSPALQPGLVLHIDHIVPWSQGGLTVEQNLQTLCEQCNLGKGDA